MRELIARPETGPWALTTNTWRSIDEDPTGASLAIVIPYARWQAEREQWWLWAGRLGVRLSPADRVEALEPDLKRLALIEIDFPSPSEGRGYSQARVLRDRFRFEGELRAVGHVKLDQLFFLSRCGFDALELSEGIQIDSALAALSQYDVAYQHGARNAPALRRRA